MDEAKSNPKIIENLEDIIEFFQDLPIFKKAHDVIETAAEASEKYRVPAGKIARNGATQNKPTLLSVR